MPRRLVLVNLVLALVSALCIGIIVKQVTTSHPVTTPRSRPPAASSGDPAATSASRPPAQAYNVIPARNLFSPTRSETPGPGIAGSAPALAAKPNLYGVVLRDGSPIAYLEDPLTKRIAGYRVGDPIAGGTLQTISADAVMISRPDGMVDVRLRDPSKPRPAPPQPQPIPGQPPASGQLPNQGAVPVPGPMVPPRTFPPPAAAVPGQPMPPPPAIQSPTGQPIPMPFGRPSPSLGRRLPPVPQDPSGQPLPAPSQ
jgi:hypothetical protein